MDSTSIEKPGFSLSENVVAENIERFIKETKGRLIIGTFASQVGSFLSGMGPPPSGYQTVSYTFNFNKYFPAAIIFGKLKFIEKIPFSIIPW